MVINTNCIVSITEANQNFSRVARLVDKSGSAIIMKNNTPRYLLVDFCMAEQEQKNPEEDVLSVTRRILEENGG